MCCNLTDTEKALEETEEDDQTEDRHATMMAPLVLSAGKDAQLKPRPRFP
jgi:hypothetical protein